VIVEPHREADRRIRGATASAAWGIGGIAIVSPLTEHVTMLERLFGFRFSKSLHLPGVAPLSVSCDRVRNALWVGGANGILVRLSNDEYQPAELGRVDLGGRIGWVALGASALDTRNRRDTSAHFLETPAGNQRVSNMRSDFMAFAPSPTGIRVFNARLDGMQEMGEIQGVPSYEAGAFDATTGCLYLASRRGQGAVVRVNADNSFTTLSMLSFPNVQGAIQARVIGDALHVICESRNRWLTWDISDPVNPVLAADDTYDVGLYWEQNPVRWITATGELLRRTGSWPGFIPQDWPIVDGGYAIEPLTGDEYRWALHGEIGQITWDQRRGVLPFRLFRSGGLISSPIKKVGCIPCPEYVFVDPTTPATTLETPGGTGAAITELAVWDADDNEVHSAVRFDSGTQFPPLTAPIRVSYYDCLEGTQPHQCGRSTQVPSDGTNIVRVAFRYRRLSVDGLRARVSAGATPTFTTSQSGFFQNPNDGVVTITRYYEGEDGNTVVQLAAAVPLGRIITIQESAYASSTTEIGGPFVRQVPPQVFFTVLASGARAWVPAPEAGYTFDTSGHVPGTYRIWWKSGAFFDPNTNQYFVFNLDGTSKLGVRHISGQGDGTPVPNTLTELSPVLDAAATQAAAEALASAQDTLLFTIAQPNQLRMAVGLMTPPAGCTGSVQVYLERTTPWSPT